MASGILGKLMEEVSCPICLELLTEPITLDCGHTFCGACIAANNKESLMGQGENSCPVCRVSYQPGNLRPNRHVANIVKALREVNVSPEEEQKRDLCVRHGERLLLFCKEDGKIICWLCERSQEHRGHHTFLVEEVAQEYKGTLQAALDKLRSEQKKAEKLEGDLEEERTSWKDLIKNESQGVQDCFKQLRKILDSEEQKELQRLEKEEGKVLNYLAQGDSELLQQSQMLRDLISDLEHRLQGSTVEMLKDVNGTLERSKTFTLKEPQTLSKEQRRVFQAPDLRGMLQVFHELTDVRRYWVNVTLDPSMNKPNVIISADQRQVTTNSCVLYSGTHCPYENDSCDDYGVLGSTIITSGKHYWEVDVSAKDAWVLGVYCASKNRFSFMQHKRMPIPFQSQPRHGYRVTGLHNSESKAFVNSDSSMQHKLLHVCSQYQPKDGYWVIGLHNSEYKAFVDPDSSKPSTLTLALTIPPHRVGVFVDCKACTLSFFNITNHGSLIYKFFSCCFSQKIYPYLNPMSCPGPLTLCPPNS